MRGSVLGGGDAVDAAEAGREGADALQADGQADVRHRAVGVAQQLGSALEPAGEQVLVRRLAEGAPELTAEMRGRDERRARQRRDVERFAVAGVDEILRAQEMAFEAQREVAAAEEAQRLAEEKQARAREPSAPPLEAADLLVQGKAEAQDAHTRLVKARARLNFALDQMDEAERQEWEVLQAEAHAEAHGQMADDPLFNKP